MTNAWYAVANVDDVPSPAMIDYQYRATTNIRTLAGIAGGASSEFFEEMGRGRKRFPSLRAGSAGLVGLR